MDRKDFIKLLAAGSSVLAAPNIVTSKTRATPASTVKPYRIKKGDIAAIVSPAGSVVSNTDIDEAVAAVKKLGLVPKLGKNVGSRWNYLGGRDTERLTDLHDAFNDHEVKVIFPIRGGYGSSRLLPMLDFDLIKKNPKAFVGYSDNTSLIVSMNQFSGLVTFYGPNALSDWTPYTEENWRKVLMENAPAGLFNPPSPRRTLDEQPGFVTIKSGKARGQLLGGNLSLLIQTLGTEWEIDTRGKILFFEDVNESAYKIDRMLTHLWLARKLQDAAGFAIGHITKVRQFGESVDVVDVIRDRFEPLGKPCYVGLTTGHISNILTLPVGVEVELDSDKGYLKAVESAVI
ncbi:LD-carboxypeptidase [bacterium]|nr:MAG: LD-carboxypeptidase [bacterium]